MLSIFSKGKKNFTVEGIDSMSIKEIMESEFLPHCCSFNLDRLKGDESEVYLNPENQYCFKSGYFTIEDFRDWAKGKGSIVKGNNLDEKREYTYYAILKKYLDFNLFINYNKLHYLLDISDNEFEKIRAPRLGTYIDQDYVDDNDDKIIEKVAKKVCDNIIKDCKDSLNFLDVQNNVRKYFPSKSNLFDNNGLNIESYKVSIQNLNFLSDNLSLTNIVDDKNLNDTIFYALYPLQLMNYGNYQYSNYPKVPNNLAWMVDLMKSYIYYKLIKETNVQLPDIKFVQSYE